MALRLARTARALPTRVRLAPTVAAALPTGARAIATTSARLNDSDDSKHHVNPFKRLEEKLSAHSGHYKRVTARPSDLGPDSVGHAAIIGGWLTAARRASDKLYFFELSGQGASVQLVVRKPELGKEMMNWPLESVIQAEGEVIARKSPPKDASTPQDQIELDAEYVQLLNPAKELPFRPSAAEKASKAADAKDATTTKAAAAAPEGLANEDLRAQHRYLDLRRNALAKNLKVRSEVTRITRDYLHGLGFTEVETPILLNSSPEGAREFLVPSRNTDEKGQPTFYALPQSPQQPKQLLIASGAVDKYFQIARCFRDEDGRKDRQPEFTQIDIEMAFVDNAAPPPDANGTRSTWAIGGSQVREVVEGLVKRIWKEVKNEDLEGWFRVMPYDVAMDVYGSDKPDTRYEMYTLPIGYYPTLSDESLDKILLDQSPSTVEWMVTPKKWADAIDVPKFAGENQMVS